MGVMRPHYIEFSHTAFGHAASFRFLRYYCRQSIGLRHHYFLAEAITLDVVRRAGLTATRGRAAMIAMRQFLLASG